MLSILIPVYNFDCTALVEALYKQSVDSKIAFEILVLDDTSTLFKQENRTINQLANVSYIESEEHYGRAKIRNELGRRAQYENLLFIDADAQVQRTDFIENYIKHLEKAQVIIGGMAYDRNPPKENALRWYYGTQRENIPATKRNINPYKSLISFNILIKKKVFNKISFEEKAMVISKNEYGHEDTLLGLSFKKQNITVLHIDNQLVHNYSETNEGFLKNSLTAVEKYVSNPHFRNKEVVAQIKIFKVYEKIKKLGLVSIIALMHKTFNNNMKTRLFSSSPSLRLFDFYRLSYLAYYDKKNRDQFQ
ncbi:glycosyl transferase [Brumimicrobium salinarum]|uniref:Glycosyl transferase n=1 Tax=Brumimicrobium salinarum TaxID=2058658 RepID=A0A2I0R0Z3_9FLAO|nr:glycosyltransferase [Brumimicrobium salinarum]PKR80261.1 glycosyl transferase [Brumimicrobium salinarum]